MTTLADYVGQCQLLEDLFKCIDGIPDALEPPRWQAQFSGCVSEMTTHYDEFFSIHCDSIPLTPMEEIVKHWDAVKFMQTHELLVWLPIFMAGSLYTDLVKGGNSDASYFTAMQIDNLFIEGVVPYEPKLILEFLVITKNEDMNEEMTEYLRREAGS